MYTDMVGHVDWETRLDEIYQLMREMSLQTDPQEMVRDYGRRMERIFPVDRRISLSRRGLSAPQFRVTRFSEWQEDINPWKEKNRLPLLKGGLFCELLYEGRPRIIDELDVAADDPAGAYLEDQKSLMAIPMLDQGVSMNMVILTRGQPAAFDRDRFPDNVWLANLFGRATHNLVLSEQVREAYEVVDRELKVVADLQRALLPKEMPQIETLRVSAYYQTSHRAGGDYYDFFPLSDGRWGILIADVSGHGTPAAVVMAITHSIAHLFPNESPNASGLLNFVNRHLSTRYTDGIDAFVTAFYAIFDPRTRKLQYSSAGHNPPRLIRCGTSETVALDKAGNLPLGLMTDVDYTDEIIQLRPGDRLVLYTDGIIEARNPQGDLFDVRRLDGIIRHTCGQSSATVLEEIISAVDNFADGEKPSDDRTLLVANVM